MTFETDDVRVSRRKLRMLHFASLDFRIPRGFSQKIEGVEKKIDFFTQYYVTFS